MAHSDAVADQAGIGIAFYVQDGVVLNATFFADADIVYVAPNRDVRPNGGALADMNIADNLRTLMHIGRIGNQRSYAAIRSNQEVTAIVASQTGLAGLYQNGANLVWRSQWA